MRLGTVPNLLIYYLLLARRRRTQGRFYKRVGIFKPDSLGDLVLALGAIRRLVEHYGEENCVLVVCPLNAELAEREFPNVERVIVPGFDGRLWRTWSALRKLRNLPVFSQGVEQLI